MGTPTVQRESLEARLTQMGVRLSKSSIDLLGMEMYAPSTGCAKLGSNSGQTRGIKIGHLIAYEVIKDILSAGYCVVGTYSPKESNQKVNDAKKKYGTDNIHVLSMAELSQLDENSLDNNCSYIFVKRELAGEACISFKETLIRMFVQPN